jgi:hypothetical protein
VREREKDFRQFVNVRQKRSVFLLRSIYLDIAAFLAVSRNLF